MKISLIIPQFMNMQTVVAAEPLVFAILAGLTPPDVELDFLDERLQPIPKDHETDLVALTVETYTARRAYQIASMFRKRAIPVVMGGCHPSFLPGEALVYADSVVIGDAEGVWEKLVRDAQQEKLQSVYREEKPHSLVGLKFDRSIFKGKHYIPISPVQFGRGCKYACDFCSIHGFYGTHVRQRPVAEVVAELEELGRKTIIFTDDNLFINVPLAEDLFKALIPLKINWGCQISLDILSYPHLLDLMAESGCYGVLIGFESLSEDSLKQMNKGWNLKLGGYETAIREIHKRGMMIYGSFVFGYDHDTVDIFDKTVDFAIRSKIALANLYPLDAMPGSKLYGRLRDQNRLIFKRWWLDQKYIYRQATFHPQQLTAEELTKGWIRANKKFYGYRSILRRALDLKANSRNLYHLGGYLGVNLLSKYVHPYKTGHRLGADTPLVPRLDDVPIKSTTLSGLELTPSTVRSG